MFGGIILIAVLVVLLTQGTRSSANVDVDATEFLRRKIAIAEADLRDVAQVQAQVTAQNPERAAGLQQKEALQREVEAARHRSRELSGQIEDQVSQQTADFAAESAKLSRDLTGAERTQTELKNTLKAQRDNLTRMNERIALLEHQMHEQQQSRIARLRLPKERPKTKASFPIILRYGKVYPVNSADFGKNEHSIAWKPASGGASERATPDPDRGWIPTDDMPQIKSFISALPSREIYFTLFAYGDSFETFKVLREEILRQGFDFGWEPVPAEEELKFGSEGHAPPPL